MSALLPTCCPPVLASPVDAEAAEQLAAAFRVLGEPARLRLLGLIAAAGADGACTCDLVEPLGLSQPTVSHHLAVLHDAGLVTRAKRGRWTYYQVAREPLEVLRSALVTS